MAAVVVAIQTCFTTLSRTATSLRWIIPPTGITFCQTISSFGDSNAYTTNTQTIGDYAAFFSNNGGGGASWLTTPAICWPPWPGRSAFSFWVDTMQATGNDTDDGLYGNAGLVSAFNGSGNSWVVPVTSPASKLALPTGGSSQSHPPFRNGHQYRKLCAFGRHPQSGHRLKKIYVNGVLDAGNRLHRLINTPTELSLDTITAPVLMGAWTKFRYSGVLASEVLQLYNNPGTATADSTGNSSSGLIAHYDFDEDTGRWRWMFPAMAMMSSWPVIFRGEPADRFRLIAGSGSISFDGGSF